MSDTDTTKRANRLIGEASRYLLDHAHDPVDWYPYGPEALERAASESKPLLLSIGYASCHWCHVMHRESFSSPRIAQLMNEHFVCIKIDREQRPDLDEIYMAVTMATTGRGGWPMTVFTTPDGQPFFAGTYFPPEGRAGMPGFDEVLREIAGAWRSDRKNVLEVCKNVIYHLSRALVPTTPQSIDASVSDRAILELRARHDERWGGFGDAPKFPPHAALRLLLSRARSTSDEGAAQLIRSTLDHMAAGGIHDHLGGGFARYSTDERWHVPHFEKMLYDNAQLLKSYAQASTLWDSEAYRAAALGIAGFIERELTDADGGLYTAIDADSEGEEGRYYVFTWQEAKAALPEPEFSAFSATYSLTPVGNWEGTNVLCRQRPNREVALGIGLHESELEALLAAARQRLLAVRSARPRPSTDDQILSGQNGLAIGALALAGRWLDEPSLIRQARAAADFVTREMVAPDGTLVRAVRGGHQVGEAVLEDYAYLAEGLLDLYESTGELSWLDAAERIGQRCIDEFSSAESAALNHTRRGKEPLSIRVAESHDGALPNPSAVAATVLVRLSYHLDRPIWRDRAKALIEAHGSKVRQRPSGHTDLLVAAHLLDSEPLVAVVDVEDTSRGFYPALLRLHAPWQIWTRPVGATDSGERSLPLVAAAARNGQRPAVYLCAHHTCAAPVHRPEDLAVAHRQLDPRA